MRDYERAIEIAGTGIGVVFLALVTLTLVTLVITRYIKHKDQKDELVNPGVPTDDPESSLATGEFINNDDPAAIAAMVAAIQVIRGSVTRVPMRPLPSSTAPTVGAWRSQGRQALMQSQGASSTPRTRHR